MELQLTSCARMEPVSSQGSPYSTSSAVTCDRAIGWVRTCAMDQARGVMTSDWQTGGGCTKCSGTTTMLTSQREFSTVLNCGTMLMNRLVVVPSRREPMTVRMDLHAMRSILCVSAQAVELLVLKPFTGCGHHTALQM